MKDLTLTEHTLYISGMDCVGKANTSKKLVQGKQLKCWYFWSI